MEIQKNVKNENLQSSGDLQLRYQIGTIVNSCDDQPDKFVVACSCFYQFEAKAIYKAIYKPLSDSYLLYDAYRRIFIDVN